MINIVVIYVKVNEKKGFWGFGVLGFWGNRQKIQAQGRHLGSLKVVKERRIRSYEMQQSMPAHRPKYEYDPITNTTQEVL